MCILSNFGTWIFFLDLWDLFNFLVILGLWVFFFIFFDLGDFLAMINFYCWHAKFQSPSTSPSGRKVITWKE